MATRIPGAGRSFAIGTAAGIAAGLVANLVCKERNDAGWAPPMRELRAPFSEHAGAEENDLCPKPNAKPTDAENEHFTVAMNNEAFKLA